MLHADNYTVLVKVRFKESVCDWAAKIIQVKSNQLLNWYYVGVFATLNFRMSLVINKYSNDETIRLGIVEPIVGNWDK